jgi:hypothetical protein
MTKRIPNSLPCLAALLLTAIIASCSDDPAHTVVHHYHPVISPGDAYLFAGYESYVEGQSASATSENFLIRTIATGAQRAVYIPGFAPHDRYWVEPITSSITIASTANALPGFMFYSPEGRISGSYDVSHTGVKPRALGYASKGGAYVWAGTSGDRVKIYLERYNTHVWTTDQETLVLDTAFNATVHDICFTSDVTFAIYLANGNVREYNMQAALLHSWQMNTRNFDDIWQARLLYKEFLGARRMYTLDDSGIVSLDLDKHHKQTVTSGYIRLFSVNPSDISELMAYETRSGDVWTAYTNGDPRSRLRQQLAPYFSASGTYLATVSRVNTWTDSLALRKSPFMM